MATMKTLNGYGFNATELNGKTSDSYLQLGDDETGSKPQSTIVHGGAGIYPLTTADQVILADGSRLEKDGKIGADSAANSAKLGGKAPEYYLQPRNLLDNSDFTNPVNQRGKSSYTSSVYYLYTIDRWLIESDEPDQIVTVNADGTITFAHTGSNVRNLQFEQKLEFPIPNGSYATVAVYVTNMTGSASLSYSMLDPPYTKFVDYKIQSGINVANGEVTADGDCKVRILLDPNSSVTMKWIALYEGSYTVDTLPPYVPKGYAAELAECQRYYEFVGINKYSIGRIGEVYFDIQFTQKRIFPTVAIALDTASNNVTNKGEVWTTNRISAGGLLYYANDANMSYWYGHAAVSADL